MELASKLNENDLLKIGMSLGNIEFFRDVATFAGEEVTTVTLGDIQSLILQINTKVAQLSYLDHKIIELEKSINRYQAKTSQLELMLMDIVKSVRADKISNLNLRIDEIEKRLPRVGINDYDKRISDIERMVM